MCPITNHSTTIGNKSEAHESATQLPTSLVRTYISTPAPTSAPFVPGLAHFPMDPISLTAAVASLTFTCAKVTKCIHAVKSTYEVAPITIIAMIAECATVSASLNQIQSLVLSNPVALSSRMSPDGSLTKNFDDALTGCMITLTVIEDELEGMVEGDQGAGTVGFKARAKFVWNEAAMDALLRQLRGQQTAIGLLVAVLQTESIAEVKEMVQKNTVTLQTMLQRARTLRETKSKGPKGSGALPRPASIFSFGMSSTVSESAPDFNQQLHQSSAYRRACEVEMEDLWKRNHALLQEKYILIERIEQLEQDQRMTEELKASNEKLQLIDKRRQDEAIRLTKKIESSEVEIRKVREDAANQISLSRELNQRMTEELKIANEKLLRSMEEKRRKERSKFTREIQKHKEMLTAANNSLRDRDAEVQKVREDAANQISLLERNIESAIESQRRCTANIGQEEAHISELESRLSDRRRDHIKLLRAQEEEGLKQLKVILESAKSAPRQASESPTQTTQSPGSPQPMPGSQGGAQRRPQSREDYKKGTSEGSNPLLSMPEPPKPTLRQASEGPPQTTQSPGSSQPMPGSQGGAQRRPQSREDYQKGTSEDPNPLLSMPEPPKLTLRQASEGPPQTTQSPGSSQPMPGSQGGAQRRPQSREGYQPPEGPHPSMDLPAPTKPAPRSASEGPPRTGRFLGNPQPMPVSQGGSPRRPQSREDSRGILTGVYNDIDELFYDLNGIPADPRATDPPRKRKPYPYPQKHIVAV